MFLVSCDTRCQLGIIKLNLCYVLTIEACYALVPKSAKTILLIPGWKKAMTMEFDALRKNGT